MFNLRRRESGLRSLMYPSFSSSCNVLSWVNLLGLEGSMYVIMYQPIERQPATEQSMVTGDESFHCVETCLWQLIL